MERGDVWGVCNKIGFKRGWFSVYFLHCTMYGPKMYKCANYRERIRFYKYDYKSCKCNRVYTRYALHYAQ